MNKKSSQCSKFDAVVAYVSELVTPACSRFSCLFFVVNVDDVSVCVNPNFLNSLWALGP